MTTLTAEAARRAWTPEQFAEAMQVSRRTVYRWIKAGGVKVNRVGDGRLIRIPNAEAERLLGGQA